ncbi:MAG: alpha/beta fold hydrolase, partial [Leptospiraceae bacterium]|nr:alpha/beta fold hydrolase [Leptospiraceae bacterium]
MFAFQPILRAAFQVLPENFQYNVGEFFWDLHSKGLYFSSKAREKFTKVNGLNISFAELGDQKNPALVILHGFSDSKEGLLSFANHLSKHFYVIVPDLPGFGKSEKPNIRYSLEFYANILHEFLAQRGITHFHAYGNSMGGAILIEYNHLYAEKILSLVLSCSAGLIPEKKYASFYEEVIAVSYTHLT